MAWLSPVLAFLAVALTFGSGSFADDCRDKLKLGIAIDVSQKVDDGAFKFLDAFLSRYTIGLSNTRVGVIAYANKAKVLFKFQDEQYQSLATAAREIIAGVSTYHAYLGNGSLTEKALTTAHDRLFKKQTDKPSVIVVFTGGKTPNPHLYGEITKSLGDRGVNIVAVTWDAYEASLIAGKRGHAFTITSSHDALSKLSSIVSSTCVLNGGYAEWGDWNECSVTCGGGSQTRARTCSSPKPSTTGKNCDSLGPAEDSRDCNTQRCGDIDGGYSDWTKWSACSHTCGGGVRKRERLCVNPPQQNNGAGCDVIGHAVQTQKCNKKPKCKGLKKSPCDEGLDLALLVDQSHSIGDKSLNALRNVFLKSFIGLFEKQIAKRQTRVGLMRFALRSHIEFNFAHRCNKSPKELEKKMQQLHNDTYLFTRIDRGLLTTYNEMFTRRAGDKAKKQNVLVVFTDGRPFPGRKNLPFNETIPPLTDDKKVHIVAVNYGRKRRIKKEVLEEIAGDDVVVMPPRSDYSEYAAQVKDMVCKVDGGYSQWSMWSLCSVSCGSGVQSRSRTCTAPPRRKDGLDCEGDSFEAQACGEVVCPKLPLECKGLNLDVAVVLDNSITNRHFDHSKVFLRRLLALFDVSQNKVHVSMVVFHKSAHQVFQFKNTYYQNNEALDSVLAAQHPLGFSASGLNKALELVDSSVFTSEAGDRPDAGNVAIFMTNGRLYHGGIVIDKPVASLRDAKNVTMVTVSEGDDIQEEVLYDIAGPNMVLTTSYQDLLSKLEHVASLACKQK